MKIAILKIGARIGSGGSNAGSGDTLMIASMLAKNDCSIDIYTKILKSDNNFYEQSPYRFFDIVEEYDRIITENYDLLLVMNGNVNFYGGVENPHEIYNYITINNFKGKVIYILCDPNLALKQIQKSIETKSWGEKYNSKAIFIDREDIICITQINNLDIVENKITANKHIKYSKFIYYPLEKFPLLKDRFPNTYPKIIDLKYGGAYRNAQREKKLIKFLFGYPEDINVQIFGTITANRFNIKWTENLIYPQFAPAVKYDQFINTMSDSLSTIIVGDSIYEGNVLTQRIYESILANNIVFIDKDFDPNKKFSSNNFHYVADKFELIEKIRELKASPNFAKQLCDEQYELVKIDKELYCKKFYEVIKENF